MLVLYDSNLSLITSGKPSITRLCGTDELPAGTYYVKITDELNDEIISYDISLTVTPCSTSGGGGGSGCSDAWSKLLTTDRFELVMNDEAVLDRETCLVWEQTPQTTDVYFWITARSNCIWRKVGGRGGWRLPTIEELHSLVDDTQRGPALPSGHPFSNVLSTSYWSTTTVAKVAIGLNANGEPTSVPPVWLLDFDNGHPGTHNKITTTPDGFKVWCVRGGNGYDGRWH
jgi:hypothetical protein